MTLSLHGLACGASVIEAGVVTHAELTGRLLIAEVFWCVFSSTCLTAAFEKKEGTTSQT